MLTAGLVSGICLAILQALALRFPEDRYLMDMRNLGNGYAAVEGRQKSGIAAKIDVVQLDVTDNEAIAAAEK